MTLAFLPNEADATFNDQAEPDAVDFQILLLGYQQTGVVSGCEVTQSAPVAMTIDVASGDVLLAGASVSVSAQADKTIAVPDATFARFDLVTINSGGTVIVTTGTAAENPALPAIPANSVPLCGVFIPADGYAGSQLTGQIKTIDNDASSVTFNLPSGAVTGDDIILLVSNASDRTLTNFQSGDGNWTVVQNLIEPPVKLKIIARTLTASDGKTTVDADTTGTGDIHCWAYIAQGIDITNNSVATFDGFSFHQYFADLDSTNTDPKLWVGISGKNQISVVMNSDAFDFSHGNVHDELQTSPPLSTVISWYASSDTEMFRLNTDGPPHWPYGVQSNNEQLASIASEFAAVDYVSDNQINDKRVFIVASASASTMFSWNRNEEETSVSSSSFAWKGSGVVPQQDVIIHALVFSGSTTGSATYQGAVITASGGTIATIDKTATYDTVSADIDSVDATLLLVFSTPIALDLGTEYWLMVGRTDSTDTHNLAVQYPANDYTYPFGGLPTISSKRVAKASPAVSDTLSDLDGAVVRIGVIWELA